MKITKQQLKRIVREEKSRLEETAKLHELGPRVSGWETREQVVDYLKAQARSYRADPSLDTDGDGASDAAAVKMLLQDDFLDNFGHVIDIRDFAADIDRISSGLNETFRVTKGQLRKIIREATLTEFWKGKEKPTNTGPAGVTFDWGSSGLSMTMYVDGKETARFSTQKEVRDLITQLEGLLTGPMRTSP